MYSTIVTKTSDLSHFQFDFVNNNYTVIVEYKNNNNLKLILNKLDELYESSKLYKNSNNNKSQEILKKIDNIEFTIRNMKFAIDNPTCKIVKFEDKDLNTQFAVVVISRKSNIHKVEMVVHFDDFEEASSFSRNKQSQCEYLCYAPLCYCRC